ncbi:MAG: 3-dehydroquinate synthase [Hyphomicrobiales bacterium]|nr:3-dehydroquinate synthase [Hyphomicrobiales bacterium]
MSQPRTVRVPLPGREYDIVIGRGLLADAGALIERAAPGARCAVITDKNVAPHYAPTLSRTLGARLIGDPIVFPHGEATKSFAHLERACARLLDARLERGDAVIALGGGVIGDLAGFAAAILKRGVRLVQIPTTLLAQVDSSVGGKTGINTAHGKNLIGAFHQPSLVIADIDTLSTLSPREFRAGYAEVVKYGLLGDAPFFDWLEGSREAVFAHGEPLIDAVERSCRAKAEIVLEDERETGRRALLNLGHTFGHALEAWAGYDGSLIHGEAIAIGMALAFRFSTREGHCREEDAARAVAHLRASGLPTSLAESETLTGKPAPSTDEIVELMQQDKKVVQGSLTLILVRAIGEAFVAKAVGIGRLTNFLDGERP